MSWRQRGVEEVVALRARPPASVEMCGNRAGPVALRTNPFKSLHPDECSSGAKARLEFDGETASCGAAPHRMRGALCSPAGSDPTRAATGDQLLTASQIRSAIAQPVLRLRSCRHTEVRGNSAQQS